MEHIKDVLGSLASQKNIPTLKNSDEMLIGDGLELLRRDMCISSFANTFDNFNKLPGTGQALEVMTQFMETTKPPLVLLYGGLGSGKTHLLEAVAIGWRTKGIFARVLKYERILAALRAGMRERAIPDYETILDNYCKAERLLIDDYGMGTKDTEWAASILEAIVDHRYHEFLPTVVSTNRDITELPPRVYSRFMDKKRAIVVINRGKDYRQRG